MFSKFLKNLSILKKFLFINLLIFIIIFALTILYLKAIQPNLINKKTSNHIQIINNTIDHIKRLKINFTEDDIRKFLFSTRFLFQNLDRVILYDNEFNLIGDTNTLDLDPRSFSQRLDKIEMDELNKNSENVEIIKKKIVDKKKTSLSEIIINYSNSKEFGKPFTYTHETFDKFLLTSIRNVSDGKIKLDYKIFDHTWIEDSDGWEPSVNKDATVNSQSDVDVTSPFNVEFTLFGANIAGFEKIAESMLAQGSWG